MLHHTHREPSGSTHPSKRVLSPGRARLITLMQRICFGRIEQLTIQDGQPVSSPHPQVIREIKLAGENGPRPELALDDFLLKRQVVDLFAQFDELQDGTVELLEIKHGLPFRMLIREIPAY